MFIIFTNIKVKKMILDDLSMMLLEGKFTDGDHIRVDLSKSDALHFQKRLFRSFTTMIPMGLHRAPYSPAHLKGKGLKFSASVWKSHILHC